MFIFADLINLILFRFINFFNKSRCILYKSLKQIHNRYNIIANENFKNGT